MVSPPKPWERGSVAAAPSHSLSTSATAPTTTTIPSAPSAPPPTLPSSSPSASSSEPPSIPARPAALSNPSMSAMASPYNSLQSSYNSPYSSYSRMGTSYSPYGGGGMYGGLGGYGGGMGTYGGGYGGYGMNSMYGGMPGMGGMGMYPGGMDPNNPSLTQSLESTTQQTFTLLHSIVQTFTGVSQMLESTFMATHSSFFAMVGVVEQFGQLRNALGSVLGLFGLVRWMKDLISGRGNSASGGMQNEFRQFINGKPVLGPVGPPAPKPNKKPLIIFFLAIFGVPYAMSKLIKVLSERAQQQQQLQGQTAGALGPLDPSKLQFARALYPFTPSTPAELALKENEIVAIMGKLDPNTGAEVDPRMEVETDWWKGRTREGREGWFPRKWVEVLARSKVEDAKKVD
ncbi:hypothetical protein SERLA73DRAFT_129691 [Serpula lacrymans var. lacrymans S7.3]|uniref:Peroxisomal membrane protein PEX13 n=2 Tax=Serpula lacrymans var. lacrymans TaxID=341189 RepID=F8PIM3_SERL3|nr:uncharacterized protein SERLADRAFT_456546 [Serpula lacrymans var. lacrymans S7.9]EGO03394.1 hypothetical protein SERLA73DRAFT_129691 [Serpula lacrymans var. lacrymans S7.3]EGO29164.1 hypothetical protein SERLADRAFT_456546 [Serpula lacrymans var. lacrymans S7.9]